MRLNSAGQVGNRVADHAEVVKKQMRYWHRRQFKDEFKVDRENCNKIKIPYKGDKSDKTNRRNGTAVIEYLQSLPEVSLVTARQMAKW